MGGAGLPRTSRSETEWALHAPDHDHDHDYDHDHGHGRRHGCGHGHDLRWVGSLTV
jgi:hypothetical protein